MARHAAPEAAHEQGRQHAEHVAQMKCGFFRTHGNIDAQIGKSYVAQSRKNSRQGQGPHVGGFALRQQADNSTQQTQQGQDQAQGEGNGSGCRCALDDGIGTGLQGHEQSCGKDNDACRQGGPGLLVHEARLQMEFVVIIPDSDNKSSANIILKNKGSNSNLYHRIFFLPERTIFLETLYKT